MFSIWVGFKEVNTGPFTSPCPDVWKRTAQMCSPPARPFYLHWSRGLGVPKYRMPRVLPTHIKKSLPQTGRLPQLVCCSVLTFPHPGGEGSWTKSIRFYIILSNVYILPLSLRKWQVGLDCTSMSSTSRSATLSCLAISSPGKNIMFCGAKYHVSPTIVSCDGKIQGDQGVWFSRSP